VIWGLHDFALEKDLTIGLEDYIDALLKVEFIDAGHWVQQEVYDEVNTLIEKFLED